MHPCLCNGCSFTLRRDADIAPQRFFNFTLKIKKCA